jgi:TetR/AcrR family transcriptional regulator, transcriptional repressor for nem operon
MPPVDADPPSRRPGRGAATRSRIVRAAAELMYAKGVAGTTLDEILAASEAGRSQFYQHFASKGDLVQDVIAFQANEILTSQGRRLRKLDSFRGLQQWRNAVVQGNALRHGAWGCRLGSLASELADTDDSARVALAKHFDEWEQLLTHAFERMRDKGVLCDDIDASALAQGLMAALQGGYLMAQTAQSSKRMEVALDMAIAHIRSFQPTAD